MRRGVQGQGAGTARDRGKVIACRPLPDPCGNGTVRAEVISQNRGGEQRKNDHTQDQEGFRLLFFWFA
jgi:hypothetical protein